MLLYLWVETYKGEEKVQIYYKDKNEYKVLEAKNFNQLDTLYKKFTKDFGCKFDSKYMELIGKIYLRIQSAAKPNISIGDKEYFRKYFHFDEQFNNDFYCIIWDIEFTKQIITSWNMEPQKIKTKDLMEFVDVESIDQLKLNEVRKLKKYDPVILVSYDPINNPVLIDGNHRVYSKKNQPNLYLDAYFLDDFLSIECMAGDVFRYLYALHYNIIKLINYDLGNIAKEDLDEMLINIK